MRANIQNDAVPQPTVTVTTKPTQPTVELWDPPFERWIRMADDMLRDWPGPIKARENRY
jgi:hypothetical protein